MNQTDITAVRAINQQISQPTQADFQQIVAWLGAMQAQDYAMVKWALGVRRPGSTVTAVEAAFNAGHILRTHLLRPTWHLVSSADIYWLTALTAPHIKTGSKSRFRELGLSPEVFAGANRLIEKVLLAETFATRARMVAAFTEAGLANEDNKAAHLLMWAELEGLITSGPQQEDGKWTYALLEERVPKPAPIERDEALSLLAQRYFSSHGPATLADFAWWSGLPITDARRGLQAVADPFSSAVVDEETYWFLERLPRAATWPTAVYLLPAFDEFIISYKNRQASIRSSDINKKVVTVNGIFRPTVIYQGQVVALWKRTLKKETVLIEIQCLEGAPRPSTSMIEEATQPLANFWQKQPIIQLNNA